MKRPFVDGLETSPRIHRGGWLHMTILVFILSALEVSIDDT